MAVSARFNESIEGRVIGLASEVMMSNDRISRIVGFDRLGSMAIDPLSDPSVGLHEAVRCFEHFFILKALKATAGNQKKAAELLGLKHTTLHAKIRRLGIDVAEQCSLPLLSLRDLAETEGPNE